MNLKDHFSPKNWVTHLATAGLIADSISNASQGYYQFAACEAVIAAYLQGRKILSGLREENIKVAEELSLRAQQISNRINQRLDQTIQNLANLTAELKIRNSHRKIGIEEIVSQPIDYNRLPEAELAYFKKY